MKRILILVAISLFLCSPASAFQGGGGESIKKGGSTKKADKKKPTPSTKNASEPKPSSANLREPKILWANDCDPRTSANYCQLGSLAILNEFYDAANSVDGTITYHVPNSNQELAPFTVVILDFCFGAANYNSINAIKQYIQGGGSAFIMGGNFCRPGEYFTSWWASELTKDFGVTFTSDDDSMNQWVDSIDVHPTTLDVNRIYVFRHAYLNVARPSKSIMRINGRPVAAIYDGTGTFVALSDETFEWGAGFRHEEIGSSNNFVFWQNALRWLISRSRAKRLKPRKASKIKNLTRVSSGDTAEGSSMTIVSDKALNDYSAYRGGDRYYVSIPGADASRVLTGLRGRGFEDVRVQKRGDGVLLSFRLLAGATARVSQKMNMLEIIITLPALEIKNSK